MTAQYPSEIATLTNPISAEGLNQPTTGVPHSVIETRQNEEILAIETELGTGLKGSKSSLAERMAVGINEDGTLKLDADDIDDTSTTNKFVTSTDLTNLSNLSGINSGDQESSDFSLAGLSDVDDTAKATGKILQVNSEGNHEYVDLPDPDVSGLVPYTGATGDVDLGNYDLTATDATIEGNVYLSNSKFIKGRNYANTANVDTIKVNEDDNIEIGADLEVGDFILEATSEPATPQADSKTIYVTATGTTPNRQVVMKIKDEAGQEVILSSLIV